MAIVKFPGLSVEASGNIGGINYTRWRGLSIARAASAPTGSATTLQLAQRALMTEVSAAWGEDLTSSDRLAWEAGALEHKFIDRLGQKYIPSGYQLFIKLNLQAMVVGGSIQNLPPGVQEGVYVFRARMTNLGIGLRILITMEKKEFTKLDADGFQIFKAGPFESGGRKAISPEFRFLRNEDSTYFTVDTDVIDTKWYWYKVRWYFVSGYTGNWFQGQILVDIT